MPPFHIAFICDKALTQETPFKKMLSKPLLSPVYVGGTEMLTRAFENLAALCDASWLCIREKLEFQNMSATGTNHSSVIDLTSSTLLGFIYLMISNAIFSPLQLLCNFFHLLFFQPNLYVCFVESIIIWSYNDLKESR